MEHRITDLSKLVEATESNLRKFGYAEHSLIRFHSGWNKLKKFVAEKGDPPYTPVIGLEFLRREVGYPIYVPYRQSQKHSLMIRSVRLLNDYQLHQTISSRIPLKRIKWSKNAQELREAYIRHCREREFAEGTIKTRLHAVDPFLRDVLMAKEIEPTGITPEIISKYIASLDSFASSSVKTWLTGLRHFFRFMLERGYVHTDLAQSIPITTAPTPERIPPILSKDDVQKLLSSIDRGNPLGKRDYAILVTVALLGLRDSDVSSLTFENFDWEPPCRIKLVQRKTGEPLYLPLLPAVGEAIIDYLRYGRPITKSQTVFVKHTAPYDGMVRLYSIMEKHMQLAGIKVPNVQMRGLHILRHTLASGLIKQGEAYTTVSAVLGHKNSASTDVYAHIDVEGLLQCALDPWEVGFCENA